MDSVEQQSHVSGLAARPAAHPTLACPESGLLLHRSSADAAAGLVPGSHHTAREGVELTPVGLTSEVMRRDDGLAAYPLVDGIPVLMVPEMLGVGPRTFDLDDPRYAEAYQEQAYYGGVADVQMSELESSEAYEIIERVARASVADRASFPTPRPVWLEGAYDSVALWTAYNHFGSVRSADVLQLGGVGTAAIKFLLGGARSATLVTPVVGEARYARALARTFGVDERFTAVVGIAEQLPFANASFDIVYSGGCVHHMTTEFAFPEVARTLRPGGKFAAIDPWRAPLYAIGTRVLGQREPGVFCRPMTPARAAPLARTFHRSAISLHGSLTRYPLLALWKMGLSLSVMHAFWIMRIDDYVCSAIPGLRRFGSSVALLASV